MKQSSTAASGTLFSSTSSYAFGSVDIGTTSNTTLSFVNQGSSSVQIYHVTLTGQAFSLSGQGNLPVTVKAGATYTVTVEFTPTDVGNASGQLTINSSSTAGAAVVPLSGTGTPGLSSIACTNGSLSGPGTDQCSVTLNAAAASGGVSVNLKSSDSSVSVPGTATVAADATSANFTANISAVPSKKSVTLTATKGKASKTFSLTLNGSQPTLTLSASSLAFGSVLINTPARQSVTLASTGTAAVTVNSATVSGTGFTVSGPALPIKLNPGQSSTLTVQFDPSAPGSATGQLTISSNSSTGSTFAVNLSGTGASTSTAALSGFTCASSSLTGASTDACTVSLSAGAPTGGLSVALASNNPSVTVPATVLVPANATSAGFTASASAVSSAQTATLTANASGGSKTFALQLNAGAAVLSLSSTTLSFGNVALNTPATQSLTLTSSGSAAVTVSAASISGTGFTYSGATFPVTLNAGQTLSLAVQFDPTTAASFTGQLSLTSNSSTGGSSTVSLSGSGATGTGNGGHTYSTIFPLTEDPISENGNWINGGTTGLDWHDCRTTTGFAFGTEPGTVNYDDTSCALTGTWGPNQTAQITVKVNSTNNATYEESEVRLRTTIVAHSITGYEINCSVKPGDPYIQIVRWNGPLGSFTELNGTTVGCVDGDVLQATIVGSTITAYKNGQSVLTATDSTYTGGSPGMGFYIQGVTGTAAAADGEFGASAFSANDSATSSSQTSPIPASLSCANASMTGLGTNACTVTLSAAAPSGGVAVALSSNNAAVTLPASVTVPAGATSAGVTASVAAVASAQTATLTASANGASQLFVLNLNATGALLGVNATTISFGNTTLNIPATQTLTLTSSGALSVAVSSVALTGTGFNVSGVSFPVTLNPGQSVTLSVQFDPTTAGSATGLLTVVSTSLTNPATLVTLTGVGVTVAVDLTWSAPSDPTDPAVSYNVYRATGTSSSYQKLNTATDVQTAYVDSAVQSGTTYQYYVTSLDSSGAESAPSTTSSVTVP